MQHRRLTKEAESGKIRSTMDEWVRGVLERGAARRWPAASRYALQQRREGLWIVGEGERALDMPALHVAQRLAAWGTPAAPPTREGLLGLVADVGLTGRWVKTRAVYPRSYHG